MTKENIFHIDFLCSQNECSFVSLRDVERAMIVLVYFYDNMNELSPLIDSHKRKCGRVSMAKLLLLLLIAAIMYRTMMRTLHILHDHWYFH